MATHLLRRIGARGDMPQQEMAEEHRKDVELIPDSNRRIK
jgi:hypothetical protein